MPDNNQQEQTRRLATILAADILGYSRLMDADEEGTYAALQSALSEVVDPGIAKHKGRIVKQNDHLMDCTRYLVRGRGRMKTQEPPRRPRRPIFATRDTSGLGWMS